MKNRKTIEERVRELEKQLDNRPSNCKHCELKLENGNAEYTCKKKERQTLFGVKTEKCYGDCEFYEKDFPELYRDMIFEMIKSEIGKRNVKQQVSEIEKSNDVQSWEKGYLQCQSDILKIISELQKKIN